MEQDSRKSLSMEYSDIATNLLSLGKRNRMKPRRFREAEENRENGEYTENPRRPDDAYFGDGMDGDDDSDGSYEDPEDDRARPQQEHLLHQNDHQNGKPSGVNGRLDGSGDGDSVLDGYGGEVEAVEPESEGPPDNDDEEDSHDHDHDPAAHSDASDNDHDQWLCNVCGRAFNSSKGLKVHKSWRHPDPGQAPHLPHHAPPPAPPAAHSKKRKQQPRQPEPRPSSIELDDDLSELAVITQLANLQRQRARLLAQRDLPQLAPDSPPKKVKKEPEEKRLARWRDRPSQAVRDRIERAVGQRMYLISRVDKSDLEKEFAVLGSVGNVYTVTVSHKPRCTCPDFEKGNLCKHILFVLLKVLRLPPDSQLIYQVALLTNELAEIFSKAPANPVLKSVMASQSVQQKYQELTNSGGSSIAAIQRKLAEGDCPICYEEMNTTEALVWCELGCGNNVHAACFQQWSLTKARNGEEINCVYCRTPWKATTPTKPHPGANDSYINLANLQPGMSTERDWYAYPKRGMSWYW